MPILLIDVDGTIVNSYPGIRASFITALKAIEQPIPEEARLRKVPGPQIYDTLRDLGLDHDTASEGLAAFRADYREHGWHNATLFPGWDTLLPRLRQQGYTLCTATSKNQALAARTLEHLGVAEHFDFIGGADVEGGRQGKQAVIQHVLSTVDADPANTPMLMIGDRTHDTEGAAHFSIPTILVGWGHGEQEEWDQAFDYAGDITTLEEKIHGFFN
ncbi:HAD hydrolase-like protein [Corynebacterium pelargi]|uniref:HAD hydrolase-like protein n=1 Tax=Corynebacterium pelargi TaxID=1471400 RepID=UPI00100933C0|nr:HAD hydrolase-like protein [Corynebacterium pelargi]GGG71302.1 phosphatase [Corynebacterium pelargi]